MTWHLQNGGRAVNRKRIRRLMHLTPIYQKPNTGLVYFTQIETDQQRQRAA